MIIQKKAMDQIMVNVQIDATLSINAQTRTLTVILNCPFRSFSGNFIVGTLGI